MASMGGRSDGGAESSNADLRGRAHGGLLPVLPWHFRTSTARTPLNLLPGRPHLYAGLCHRRRELAECGDHVEGTAADRGRLIHRRVAAVVLALGRRQDRSAG